MEFRLYGYNNIPKYLRNLSFLIVFEVASSNINVSTYIQNYQMPRIVNETRKLSNVKAVK